MQSFSLMLLLFLQVKKGQQPVDLIEETLARFLAFAFFFEPREVGKNILIRKVSLSILPVLVICPLFMVLFCFFSFLICVGTSKLEFSSLMTVFSSSPSCKSCCLSTRSFKESS